MRKPLKKNKKKLFIFIWNYIGYGERGMDVVT